MASLNSLEIILDFEPIVKLVCESTDCVFNLMNSANIPERREPACNLKQITINDKGQCANYLSLSKENETQ